MLPQNKAAFEYCNIPLWHKSGFTGRGIKIGIIDNDMPTDAPYMDGKIHPVPELERGNTDDASHGLLVADIIHQVAPDANIYPLSRSYPGKPGIEESLEWAYREGITIINMSMGGFDSEPFATLERKAYDRGITLITSAGNKGDSDNGDSLGPAAGTGYWVSVGACELKNGILKRADFSSIGPELDVMGLTGLYVHSYKTPSQTFPFSGTSCSSPFVAGMTALYYQWHLQEKHRYPTPKESLAFMVSNCEDLLDPDHDIYTGYGLFKLPIIVEAAVSEEIILQIGSKKYIHNGVIKEMDVKPFIQFPGRTMVPIRFVAEALGCEILWNRESKTVTIFKKVGV